MIYTALAVMFFVVCAGLGAAGGVGLARPRVAVVLAATVVAAQLALLLASR